MAPPGRFQSFQIVDPRQKLLTLQELLDNNGWRPFGGVDHRSPTSEILLPDSLNARKT
jgi:hypothetical protein